jgi:hypothetical protein
MYVFEVDDDNDEERYCRNGRPEKRGPVEFHTGDCS